MYKITPYSFFQAKKLNVNIKPSLKTGKKIDVYKNGRYITSIGDIKYLDYPTYIKKYGLRYAMNRRKLYKLRNYKTGSVKNTPAYYSYNILW